MIRLLCCAVLVLAGCLVPRFADATKPGNENTAPDSLGTGILIGILEEDAQQFGSATGAITTTYYRREVRVVFRQDGRDWKPFPSYCPDQTCLNTISAAFPQKTIWNIVFNGRYLGTVDGQIEKHLKNYADVGSQEITGKITIPTVGRRSVEYAGFTGVPVYRPLLAVSAPDYENPDGWRKAVLPFDIRALARIAFRHRFPVALNCKNPYENIVRKTSYGDEDIITLDAYSSQKHWFLVHLKLENYNCDGPPDDPYTGDTPFTDQWLAVSPADQVTFLEAGMSLVDAGDYGNSGTSDLVFSIDRYNQGGYIMYYNSFKQHVDFTFGYQ